MILQSIKWSRFGNIFSRIVRVLAMKGEVFLILTNCHPISKEKLQGLAIFEIALKAAVVIWEISC